MALEDIIKSVDIEAKRKAEDIMQRGCIESERILDAARQKAETDLASASKQAAQDAESRKSISLLSKRMDLRREYYSELNRRINEGKEHIRDSFAEFRNTETYKMMLQLLYDKAVSNLGEECSMRIREADIKSIKASQKTKIVTDNTFEGGIVCTSSNGSSMVDYSLSSIMDEVAVKIEPSFSDLISNGDNGAQQHSASARARHAAQSRMSSKK